MADLMHNAQNAYEMKMTFPKRCTLHTGHPHFRTFSYEKQIFKLGHWLPLANLSAYLIAFLTMQTNEPVQWTRINISKTKLSKPKIIPKGIL